MKKVCVIGGGISGLAVGYKLKKNGFEVTLFEKDLRLGGQVKTQQLESNIIELGPNSTSLIPELKEVLSELNLESINLSSKVKGKYLFTKKHALVKFPNGPKDILVTKIFSLKEKLKIFSELFYHPSSNEQNLGKFLRARFGPTAVELVANSALQGIYGCTADELELESAAPKLLEVARLGHSILKSVPKMRLGAYPCSIVGGLSNLTAKLAETLSIRNQQISRITNLNNKFQIEEEEFDYCILATNASASVKLIGEFEPSAKVFNEIKYTKLFVNIWDLGNKTLPSGFGILAPELEIMGFIFYSNLFPERTNTTILTTISKSDSEDKLKLHQEIELVLGVKPSYLAGEGYESAIPIYGMGYHSYLNRISEIETKYPGLYFTGSWTGGIALSSAFTRAKTIADKIGANKLWAH